jgi:hypothetical protein
MQAKSYRLLYIASPSFEMRKKALKRRYFEHLISQRSGQCQAFVCLYTDKVPSSYKGSGIYWDEVTLSCNMLCISVSL